MARISDQYGSAVTRCKEHGKQLAGVFIYPDAGDGFAPGYVCGHCLDAKGFERGQQITAEQAQALLFIKNSN